MEYCLRNCLKILRMKKILLFVLVFGSLFLQRVNAQIGLNLGYRSLSIETEDNEVTKDLDLSGISGFHAGLNYWFRLKKYRVEFSPEVSYSSFKFEGDVLEQGRFQFQSSYANLQFHTNIYPFDFAGDCDCPTFSKQGPSLAKGFFVQLSPGVSYINNQAEALSGAIADSETDKQSGLGISLGLGVGLDIGVSDFLTITPMVRYEYYSQEATLNRYLFPNTTVDLEGRSSLSQIFAGVRMFFRFDELR